ncbi:DnaJ domain-containing protein [bacterium]|nr:DnaJ domain-containing protein [bacterium]
MKDYYLLLGVNKEADKNEIKKAYRDSAKRFHPDGGNITKDSKKFREITEAYETLSDNGRRKEYDKSFTNRIPITPPFDVESLKPIHSCFKHNPNPYVQDFTQDYQPESFSRNIRGKKSINYVIHLTPQENQHDIEYPYTINIVKPCPHCNSLFSGFVFFCPRCNGSQYLYEKKELIINIPQGIENGTCVHLDLDHVGLSEVSLKVKILVSSDRAEYWF